MSRPTSASGRPRSTTPSAWPGSAPLSTPKNPIQTSCSWKSAASVARLVPKSASSSSNSKQQKEPQEMTSVLIDQWVTVCPVSALLPGRGVAAMVDGTQVALFRVDDDVLAVSNYDPFSGANVI